MCLECQTHLTIHTSVAECWTSLGGGASAPPTPASDVYALAVLLWGVWARQRPYAGLRLSPAELREAVCARYVEKKRECINSIPTIDREALLSWHRRLNLFLAHFKHQHPQTTNPPTS